MGWGVSPPLHKQKCFFLISGEVGLYNINYSFNSDVHVQSGYLHTLCTSLFFNGGAQPAGGQIGAAGGGAKRGKRVGRRKNKKCAKRLVYGVG